MNMYPDPILIYGPPGSGKSAVGKLLAENLKIPFVDLDAEIEARTGQTIPQIFSALGESGFREREKEVLQTALSMPEGVIALGGGSLLDEESRRRATEQGRVVCLVATLETILQHMGAGENQRPLLEGDLRSRLANLLEQRESHYASFPLRCEVDGLSVDEVAWQVQICLGRFQMSGMGPDYAVSVRRGNLEKIGSALQGAGLQGPLALVSDDQVAPLYAEKVWAAMQQAGYEGETVTVPAGEATKNLTTVALLWKKFLELGLERGSTVVSLGGGVVSDLAGFAAAAYLRGVRWAAVPTSLLAMCDASLGGKTGVDLPEGKNLVGAFHAPTLVWMDPDVLSTLPRAELRSGMAEVVKHGVIADPALFALCAHGLPERPEDWETLVTRAVAVKARTIQVDPFERGVRAALNFGHTLGHGIEAASHFTVRHGEAVGIGMCLEARLAERLGLAETGLEAQIAEVLLHLGLPVRVPASISTAAILDAMTHDKKKSGGKLRFALPVRVGAVQTGVAVERAMVEAVFAWD